MNHQQLKPFISIFNTLAQHRRRYVVFSDFVEMTALALQNGCKPFIHEARYHQLENQFLALRGKYSDEDYSKIRDLFHCLIDLLSFEPTDVLGQLYMLLELGNSNTGQFFTPNELSTLMARLTWGDAFDDPTRPYLTFSDPACGAGSTLIAALNVGLERGKNPLHTMWMYGQDIDRSAAMMCYIQLTLLGVPACVAVGDTLSAAPPSECFYTLMHYLGRWGPRLNRDFQQQQEAANDPLNERMDPAQPIRVNSQMGFNF